MSYDPAQPRDERGEWTSGAGGAEGGADKEAENYKIVTDAGSVEPHAATPDEQKSIHAYQGSSYIDLNRSLRHGTELSPQSAKVMGGLDSYMKDAALQEPTALWRGFAADDKMAGIMKSLRPGDSFLDNGFTSTSLLPDQARKFQYLGMNPNAGVMKILAPAGSHAAILPGHYEEAEVLVNRGSTFKFLGRDKNGANVFHLAG